MLENTEVAHVAQFESGMAIHAVVSAEIDIQISTAKKYPRNLGLSLKRIKDIACLTQETAIECFYSLPRKDEHGNTKNITGMTIRMAEIVASQYGNIRYGSRVMGHDGKMITAQGICHDLENNVAVTKEVQRRITTRAGKTYGDDMIIMTGNAAASIAMRNAVFTVIPKALMAQLEIEVRNTALGKNMSTEQRWVRARDSYKAIGVTEKQLMEHLQIVKHTELTEDHFSHLIGLHTAITKEKMITVEEAFNPGNAGKDITEMVSGFDKLNQAVNTEGK